MINVKSITHSEYRVLLGEQHLQMIEDLQKYIDVNFSGAMHAVIDRGLIELTGELPENRS